MNKVNVLVVEDNLEYCEILENFFALTEDVVLCDIANDGNEALRKIKILEPDVILLDIIMPNLDGLSVLERLPKTRRKPYIIISTAVGQDKITNQALRLGADYYMIKPYGLNELYQRIKLLTTPSQNMASRNKRLLAMIKRTVMELGVPTHILGYKYIVEGLYIIISEDNIYPISTQVYETIAKNYDTTAACVESAMRKTINRIYETPTQSLIEILGGNDKPSNAKFLTAIAEKIMLEEGAAIV